MFSAPTAPANCKVVPVAHDTQRVQCDQPGTSSVPTKYKFQKNSEAAVENPAGSLTTAKHTFESLDAASFYMYRVGAELVALSGTISQTSNMAFWEPVL